MKSIVEALAAASAAKPDVIAVIAEGQQITYEELWKETRGFAAYLQSLGFEKGARVLVKSRPDIWFVVACFGIQLAGYTHVPLEKTIGTEGLKDIGQKLSASALVADVDLEAEGYKTISSGSVRELAVENFDEGRQFIFPDSEDVCDILFTTGTTGKPKGVVLSHRAVLAVAENVQCGIGDFDGNVYLMPSPIDHAAGVRNLYLCVLTATTAVLLDGYSNAKRLFEYIRNYHVTSLYLPPSAVRMMIMLASKELAKYADQIRFIYTSSAPFPAADRERLTRILPKTRLYFAYGCSEAGRACIIEYSKQTGRENCAGRPNKNSHVFVVDEDRKEIQSSLTNQGLFAISGPTVMNGYYNDPDLTRETLVDGVLYTNDIGYIDPDGFVYVLGRRGDVINVGGLKIAPTEVENVALRYPGVAECVCYPVEDRFSGVAPKLNIVEERGAFVDISALRGHMLRSLEAYKVPKQIEKVDAIPKTANGKIDRKNLKM